MSVMWLGPFYAIILQLFAVQSFPSTL